MTERKYLLPQVTADALFEFNKRIAEDSDKIANETIEGLLNDTPALSLFFIEHQKAGNYMGATFAISVYQMLKIASEQQQLGKLPIISDGGIRLVGEELSTKSKDGFFYEMIERLREDNRVLAVTLDRQLNRSNDLNSVIPAVELYRMLEIAAEKELESLVIDKKYRQ
ncbi:hypothetical protein GOV03_03875 [Candidatus Woesearchaeota archaeon]|nr:hypothetical protein [Candidatus Woesearchaeota archaeon]